MFYEITSYHSALLMLIPNLNTTNTCGQHSSLHYLKCLNRDANKKILLYSVHEPGIDHR